MDRDLKKGMERLERATEVAGIDQMNADMIGHVLETKESVEEYESLLKKLESRLRVARWTSIALVIAIIIVLLYSCAAILLPKKQTVTDTNISFRLEVPAITGVSSVRLSELVANLGANEFIDYMNTQYYPGDTVTDDVVLYSLADLETKMKAANRVYSDDGEPFSEAASSVIRVGCSKHTVVIENDIRQDIPTDFYFCQQTEGYSGLNAAVCEYSSASTETLKITLYDAEDVNVQDVMRDALQELTYSEGFGDVVNALQQRLEGIDYEIVYGDTVVSSVEGIENAEGTVTFKRDGRKITPETVSTYSVSVYNCEFVPLVISKYYD